MERVRIIGEEILSRGWGRVKRTTLELRRRSGVWQRLTRETYDTGDGAAVLPYSPAKRTVILTRQFRFPACVHGDDAWLIEAPAGKLDGDDPATCATREAEEETGHRLEEIEAVTVAYSTPGSVTERLHLFIGRYEDGSRISEGGGLEHEGEDIEVLELPYDEALAMASDGRIVDAKTIILLQHLRLSGKL